MPVAAPTNLSYGKVVWQSVSDIVDGTDTDSLPDFIAPTGTVTFVASMVAGRNITAIPNPVTVLRDPITGILDAQGYLCTPDPANSSQAGVRGVWLIATDDPDLNPRVLQMKELLEKLLADDSDMKALNLTAKYGLHTLSFPLTVLPFFPLVLLRNELKQPPRWLNMLTSSRYCEAQVMRPPVPAVLCSC